MTSVPGIDVAHPYQTVAQVTAEIKAGRAKYVIVKATEGTGYTSPGHDGQVAAARGGGVPVGHYHFALPGDVGAQVRYFLAAAKVRPGDALALDLESRVVNGKDLWAPYPWAYRAAFAVSFLAQVNAATGARCLWYTNGYWHGNVLTWATTAGRAALAAAPLWIATAGKPAGQPGTSPWAMHQYSTAGGIDRNVLAVPWASFAVPQPTPTDSTTKGRKYQMLIFAKGDDWRCAAAVRGAVTTDNVAEAKAAIARGDTLKVLGGPAAAALGLAPGVHGATEVIVGQTYRDTFLAAAKLVS